MPGQVDDDTALEALLSILDRPQFDFVRVAAFRESLHGSQALRSESYVELYAFHTRSLSTLNAEQRQTLVDHLCAYFQWDDDSVYTDLHDALRSAE